MVTSQMTLQAIDSQTCGHYCLMFLKARAFGYSFHMSFKHYEISKIQF